MSTPEAPQDFSRLVEGNYERVFAVIYRLLGDRQEAEDLTQETFVNAYRAWSGFRGDSKPYTWLCRIAINLCRNRVNQLQRRLPRAQRPSAGADEDWTEQVADAALGPEEHAQNADLGAAVADAVLRLAPEYREVIILREYEGFSYEEIARLVGCSVPAVKSRLFRARAWLRRRLAPYLQQ